MSCNKKLPNNHDCNNKSDDVHVNKFEHDKDRGSWSSKTEFILSCLGYAIGIGNVWRFPYLCYRNGGGAFLVPYILMLILCGIPLFFMEVLIGQFSSTGCISMFRMCPILKGTGFAILIVNFICTVYYTVIISYPVMFVINSLSSNLPWEDCSNPWNTENCFELHLWNNSTAVTDEMRGKFEAKVLRTPADEFFHLQILQISDGIHNLGRVVWPLFGCLTFSWIIVFICIVKGVKTVGKVVYFTATFPFIVLGILFIRGITLPGAGTGIFFYIYPDWEKLKDLRVWADAAVQIFFSLGPGWGGIVNMASYNDFRNNAKWDAIYIPIINSSTSIFAGFVVFSVLGYLSNATGIPVEKVATSGPGLAFVTYPEAIALLPLPQLWAILFFLMLFFLGLDSVFVQIEAIISSVVDEYKPLRKHKFMVTLCSCIVMYLLSLMMATQGGMYILQLLDWYAASIAVILICIMETVIVGWTYGIDRFCNDVLFMIGIKPAKIWTICWKYITPTILLFIFINTIVFNRNVTFNEVVYPSWAIVIGWCSCCISIICIPNYIVYKLCKGEGTLRERFKQGLNCNDWSPASPIHKQEYEQFLKTQKINQQQTIDMRVI